MSAKQDNATPEALIDPEFIEAMNRMAEKAYEFSQSFFPHKAVNKKRKKK